MQKQREREREKKRTFPPRWIFSTSMETNSFESAMASALSLSLCLKAPHRLSLSKKNSLSVCFLREHRPFASLAYIPSDSLSLKFMTLSLSLWLKKKKEKKNYPTAKHHRRYVRPSVPTELLLPLVNILFYRRLYIGIKSLLVPTFSCDFHFSS